MATQWIDGDQAARELLARDDILILTHQGPDGDTLGCAYALWRALTALGKRARVECPDPLPERFSYLHQDCEAPAFQPAYIMTVDVADTQLLGDLAERYAGQIALCIDHHSSNIGYAEKTFLRPAAAACELIYEVLKKLSAPITKQIADCLYTGIATDSGCFKYSNTTADTHRTAAALFEAGADYEQINRYLFDTKSKSRVAIEQQVLSTMEYFFEGRMAVILITQAMLESTKADESELDGVSSLPRMIEGVEIGVTFREKAEGGFKVSVRTTSTADASAICGKFGGGGHQRAAGCRIEAPYPEAKRQFVAVCEEFLPQSK